MSKEKTLGTAFENRVVAKAQEHGLEAHRQPGSGVFKEYPSDVVIEKTLVECKVRAVQKTEDGDRYVRFDLNWVDKVMRQAEEHGFDMGVAILQPKSLRRQYVVLDLHVFLDMLTKTQRETLKEDESALEILQE